MAEVMKEYSYICTPTPRAFMARSRANITLYPRRYKFVFYVPFK
jgi:hypothetical protein